MKNNALTFLLKATDADSKLLYLYTFSYNTGRGHVNKEIKATRW